MKQRISAIILLLSFLGVVAHDIIPHHHHNTEESSELHFNQHADEHDHHSCTHHGESENKHESEELSEAHHHHCSHELHNCTFSIYDPGRALNPNTQVLNTALLASALSANQQSINRVRTRKYFDNRALICSNIYLSNSQLRAPPVVV